MSTNRNIVTDEPQYYWRTRIDSMPAMCSLDTLLLSNRGARVIFGFAVALRHDNFFYISTEGQSMKLADDPRVLFIEY